MSFAADTRVNTPGGMRPIGELRKDDSVLAASLDGGKPIWSSEAVVLAADIPGGERQMVVLRYGADGELVATFDQPFLLASGKVKEARLLVPGDALLGADGEPVALNMIVEGTYSGALADIVAGTLEWHGTIDGHLLDVAGLACGDYLVEVQMRLRQALRAYRARGEAPNDA
ncbi:MAG TPA: Hint domain-containing protein [Allosphingosinicella sp.]|nr:Hint domain-containing protein [Allosphingosinicella sp.]